MKSVQGIGRKEYSMMASENVRLTNLLAEKDSQIKFLEEENTCLVSELNEGERLRLDLEQQVLQWKSKYETEHMSAEEVRVECESLKSRVSEFESLAKDAGTDYESMCNIFHKIINNHKTLIFSVFFILQISENCLTLHHFSFQKVTETFNKYYYCQTPGS